METRSVLAALVCSSAVPACVPFVSGSHADLETRAATSLACYFGGAIAGACSLAWPRGIPALVAFETWLLALAFLVLAALPLGTPMWAAVAAAASVFAALRVAYKRFLWEAPVMPGYWPWR